MFNGEILSTFLFTPGKKARMFALTTCIQHYNGDANQCDKGRKRGERHRYWKGGSKTDFFCSPKESKRQKPQNKQ